FSPPNHSTAGGLKPAAPQERTPTEQRAVVLECLIADCTAKQPTATTPRVVIASGDIRNLTANFTSSAPANAPTALRAPQREHFQLIDYPTAPQSYILLAQVLPPSVAKDPLAAQLVVSYLLRSRLMDNLRSAKGWSYEVYPFAIELRRGGALARFNIPVQTDKTAESIAEVRKEIARLQNEPVTPEQLNGVRAWLEAALTGGLLSLESMNAQLLELARNDLPLDYYTDAVRRLAAFTPADVQTIARELFTPDRLIWIIAGQRAAIEGELRELGVEVHSAP
ncbi:MAG TPA: insulinase family protein, partial [Thermoanaerobaculia bacterium]|nr:insulinase family protein [Thermoanaerobaculia bacterium]